MSSELFKEQILRLKKEKNITILAHSYQSSDIIQVADFVGDSFQLSVWAREVKSDTIVVCGVHFMAETVKILSPNKNVILANCMAGCPMAEQFTPDFVEEYKKSHPKHTVVAYVNTTAALKTVCDVCVTSSSAVKICSNIENTDILFIPDCNLGAFVAKQLPNKNIELLQGGCPVHNKVTLDEVLAAKIQHPNALLLSHPECIPAVLEQSDFVGSTADIMNYAKNSECSEFIIGTEISIAEHLSYACPDKRFYILSKSLICPDMKITTLPDLLKAVDGSGGLVIEMDDDTIKKAFGCIDQMLSLNK